MPQVKSLRHQHLLLEEHKGHPGVVLKGRTSSCNEAQIRVKKRCLGDLRAAGEMEPVRYTTFHSQAIPKLLGWQKKGKQESPEIHQDMNGIHRRVQPPLHGCLISRVLFCFFIKAGSHIHSWDAAVGCHCSEEWGWICSICGLADEEGRGAWCFEVNYTTKGCH